jgi:hypothetical protein
MLYVTEMVTIVTSRLRYRDDIPFPSWPDLFRPSTFFRSTSQNKKSGLAQRNPASDRREAADYAFG